jgi:hypothetical protein
MKGALRQELLNLPAATQSESCLRERMRTQREMLRHQETAKGGWKQEGRKQARWTRVRADLNSSRSRSTRLASYNIHNLRILRL